MIGSMAGTPLSQTKGGELDKAHQQNAEQSRQTEAERKAESAAGIGQTEQDEQASQRDADGRRLWEEPAKSPSDPEEESPSDTSPQPGARDPSGTRGTQLDLEG